MKLLVVVDMQNDFIDGTLGSKEAAAITENVKLKIKTAIQNGETVVYTRDTHTEAYMNTQEGKNLPVIHCVKDTSGWEIADGIYQEGCKIIDKPSFGSIELAEWIAEQKDIEKIELIGLCTDICVISNAMIIKAKLPEIPVLIDASCCAGVTPQSHLNALEAMKMCQIIVHNL